MSNYFVFWQIIFYSKKRQRITLKNENFLYEVNLHVLLNTNLRLSYKIALFQEQMIFFR